MSGVGRREFVALLGGSAAWPIAAGAQQAGKLPTIGFLASGTPATNGQWVAAFVQRMRELGWADGRTVILEIRWANGRPERFAEIAAEFIRMRADAIVSPGGSAYAVKQSTQVIPIIFAAANDPIGSGLVVSLARPGGNVTGLSNQSTDLAAKRLELMREVVPGARHFAMLTNGSNPSNVLETTEIKAAARSLGLELDLAEIQRAEDIAPAVEGLKGQVDALYVSADPVLITNRIRINTLANVARLPTIYSLREFVETGGLMSYGPNIPDQFRRAAELVDKILRGAKPGDMPVEQPTKFDLIINLKSAKALGLAIPESFLLRADEVIE
jgi:putative tryptophan/tyrosine transport system substrate-binding protein